MSLPMNPPEGLTLRDWFALVALPAYLPLRGPSWAAQSAYEIADAMIAAREEKK